MPPSKPNPAPPIAAQVAVELRVVEDLKPYERNARKHPPEQVDQIVASIREYGFTSPVLADELDNLHAGHGRLLAVKKIYAAGEAVRLPDGRSLPKGTIPVIDCTGWSEAQRRAYVIADNRIAETSTWDDALLKIELGDLRGAGFDLSLTGFDAKALGEILAEAEPPEDFNSFGEDIETEHVCPKCSYRWSGKAS